MLCLIQFNDEPYFEELGEYSSIQELKEDLLASYDSEDLENLTIYEVERSYRVNVHRSIDIIRTDKEE